MESNHNSENGGLLRRIRRKLIGEPRDLQDTSLFHKISLIPVLAWIGLGADGLSSSSYGPEEAFKALGEHTYLAVFLALMTALTVIIISYAYTRIIEHFPTGGGGYVVATHTLGEKAGVVSGSALLVDYVLTIAVSIASCADAIFSFIPIGLHHLKVPFAVFLILVLIVLNLRGVKESVTVLAPIFVTFVLSHVFLLGYGILTHVDQAETLARDFHGQFQQGLTSLGGVGMLLLFLHAYSLGGGTYTGIEAVSNGLQIMREPRVQTGKRTMAYLAASLALTAGGIFVCYLLLRVKPVEGQTLNAVLAGALFGHWTVGPALALITILSEGALLFVAAQAGFIDGPRVMSNMAIDSWFPHRFAALSERLSMQNGVLLMGGAAMILLLFTHGSVSALVIMYSINVFATFSLSQLGMARFYIKGRHKEKKWKQHLPIHIVGLVLCLTILIITTLEKFTSGGWLTLVITAGVIGVCYLIRRHYFAVRNQIRELDEMLLNLPFSGPINQEEVDPHQMTAVQLVTEYNGFGVHTLLSIVRSFPGLYKNVVFVSVAVADSGSFKGAEEVEALRTTTRDGLLKYVTLARKLGLRADYRMEIGTDVVETATTLCEAVASEFNRSTFFTGQLVFRRVHFFQKLLHNETAYAIQRRLQWSGLTTVVLPIRVNA